MFSKFDMRDAYKLVPAKPKDYKLQGFNWLDRYFVETQETFGGIPSVCNFDRLGKTKDLIVCLCSGTSRNDVYRVLDDSPCVGKAGSGTVENFSRTMREICADTNIPLADNCPQNDKAFECQQRGTVLGVGFDSRNMTWFLGKDKADKVVKRCMDSRRAMHMDLNQVQKLMGTVNDIAQMCPMMTCHKATGNAFLRSFEGKENLLKPVPEDMKEDMKVIAKMADTARVELPIAKEPRKPNLAAKVFYTDAAGASYTKVQGEKSVP